MPDAATRTTIFFEASGGTSPTGWTETFYSSETDLDVLLDLVQNKYLPKRADLLGKGARIRFIRASHIPPNRLAKTRFVGGKDAESLTNVDPGDVYDPVQTDLLFAVTDAVGHRRQYWLAGLPDRYTDQLIRQGVTAPFLFGPEMKKFLETMYAMPFLIRWKSANGPPPVFTATRIVEAVPVMIRNRKRGRPFKLFRGRRQV